LLTMPKAPCRQASFNIGAPGAWLKPQVLLAAKSQPSPDGIRNLEPSPHLGGGKKAVQQR
jgi:hypothetical protein